MMLKVLYWVLTLIDVFVALIILISALSHRLLNTVYISRGYSIGLLIAGIGFMLQVAINVPFLLFDVILTPYQSSFFIFKDIGIGIVTISYCIHPPSTNLPSSKKFPHKRAAK